MPLEPKQSHGRDREARADLIKQTVSAYADDAAAFTRDLLRAEAGMPNAHLGSKECSCGLCSAVMKADLSEVIASAHLVGEQTCGCGRCMALAELADEAPARGPSDTRLDVADLQRRVDAGQQQPAAPDAQPGPAPAAQARVELGAATRLAGDLAAAAGDTSADIAELPAAAVVAAVTAELARATGPGPAYLGALSGLFDATAEMVMRAGTVASALPPGFPGTLGLTNINLGGFTQPNLVLATASRAKAAPPSTGPAPSPAPAPVMEWVSKINPTTVADSTHPSVASPTGKHKYTTLPLTLAGKPTTFDVLLEITPAYHTKISNAEQEHLNDLLVAYNLSIKAAGDAVNSLVAHEYVASTQAAAETAAKGAVAGKLHASMTADPAIWRSQLAALCVMSANRDTAGWHTFGLDSSGPAVHIDIAAKTITQGLNDGTTSINATPSATVIHF